MWSAQITSLTKANGRLQITVQFSSTAGEEAFNRDYLASDGSADINWLKRLVQTDIDRTAATYALADVLPLKQSLDLTLPDVVVPIDVAARNKYFKDVIVLQGMKQAVANGVMKESDQSFIDQQALVKSEFLLAYVAS